MQRNNAEDEDNGQGHDHDRVDLEPGGLISVELYQQSLAMFLDRYIPIIRQLYLPRLLHHDRTLWCVSFSLSFISPFPPAERAIHLLNMVLELPPAPAALVLLGLWFAVFSARSAAAFLRITVAGPPGGFGDA